MERYTAHVFAIVMMFIIATSVFQRKRYWNTQIRLYLVLVIGTLALLIMDIFSGILNETQFPGSIAFHYGVNVVFFILIPTLSGYFWFLYVDYYIAKEAFNQQRTNLLLVTPLVVNAALSIASVFGDVYFNIDALNHYTRGTYYFISVMISYGYYFIATSYIFMHRRRIRREDIIPMAFYPIPVFIAGIVEIAFHVNVAWPTLALVIFVFYVHFMQVLINTDHLTRVANRFELDKYAELLTTKLPTHRFLGGLMIDINNFKQINDRYGHAMGDTALTIAANILRNSVRKEDFVARYGGDEFVILCMLKNPHQLNIILSRIYAHVNDHNSKNMYPFKLSFSIGHGIYSTAVDESVPSFIQRLDQLMYQEKQKYAEPLNISTMVPE